MGSTKELRVWSRTRGLDFNSGLPLVQLEFYFPEIDDPRIIVAACNDFREEFDMKGNEQITELSQYRNDNTRVYHIVGKKTVVAPRECSEKRLFFQAKRAVQDLNETEALIELGEGSSDDVYAWISSPPNEICPEVAKGAVRAERIFGFNKIGRCKDLPSSRRGNGKGCYIHDMFANDVKLGSWAMRMALPFMKTSL